LFIGIPIFSERRLYMKSTVLLLLLASSAAHSQQSYLYAAAGASFPREPANFVKHWNIGVGAGGGLEVRVSKQIGLFGELYFSSFGYDTEVVLRDAGVSANEISIHGGTAVLFAVSGGARMFLAQGSVVNPYGTFGGGLLSVSTESVTVNSDSGTVLLDGEDKNAASIVVGAGVDFTMTRAVNFFVEVNYIIGFKDGNRTAYLPARIGLRLRV
jgi:opacity protein-like surface antigen